MMCKEGVLAYFEVLSQNILNILNNIRRISVMLASITAENRNRHLQNTSQKYQCLRQQNGIRMRSGDVRCEDVRWNELANVQQRALILALSNLGVLLPTYILRDLERKKVNICLILFSADFLFSFFLDPEDRSNIFLQSLWLPPNYMALNPRRSYSSMRRFDELRYNYHSSVDKGVAIAQSV